MCVGEEMGVRGGGGWWVGGGDGSGVVVDWGLGRRRLQ